MAVICVSFRDFFYLQDGQEHRSGGYAFCRHQLPENIETNNDGRRVHRSYALDRRKLCNPKQYILQKRIRKQVYQTVDQIGFIKQRPIFHQSKPKNLL